MDLIRSTFISKRSKALFVIAIIATSIAELSKKVISYPVEVCTKRTQEFTFKER